MLRARLGLGLGLTGVLTGCFSPDAGALETDAGSSTTATDSASASGASQTTTGASSTDATTATTTTTMGTSTTMDPSTSGGSGSTGGGIVQLECVEEILDPALGSPVASISTLATGDDFTGSCGGTVTNDVAYQWIAPFSDFFVFDTQGSSFDTSLYLLDGTCDGSELACSNDAEGSLSSRIVASFEEGDQVVVVVDGIAGEDGDAVLNINAVDCPSADLTGQALPATFSNVAGTNQFSSPCGGDGNLERSFRFTPELSGLYSFRATSMDFSPIVEVQQGPECGGTALQCNGGGSGQVGGEVIRFVDAGQSVTVIVDSAGGTGEFEIDITDLSLTCPQNVLEFDFMGSIDDFDHRMTASCGPIGEANGPDVNLFNAATFSWTSPGMVGSSSGCNVIYEGGFPAAITLQEGGACAGPELQCDPAEIGGGADMTYEAVVTVGHIPATTFTVTVTQTAANLVPIFGTDFQVRVECFAVG